MKFQSGDLFRFFFLPAIQPRKHFFRLVGEGGDSGEAAAARKIGYALILFITIGVLYTLTVAVGYQRGFGAFTEPFLSIPAEDYYLWESFFAIPVFLLAGIVYAGTARLLGAAFRGRGTFESLFAVYAAASTLPIFLTMWLPETILIVFFPEMRLTPLGGFAFFPLWLDILRQVAGFLWPIVVSTIGIREAEGKDWLTSGMTSLIAFIPTGALILIFVR